MQRLRPRLIATLAVLVLTWPASAEDRPPSSQSLRDAPGCDQAGGAGTATAQAATRTPSSAGATGWHGGTGGSYLGTTSSGATPTSPTWQPPTARGLDPIAAPKRPASAC